MPHKRNSSKSRPMTEKERSHARALADYENDLQTQTDRGAAILAFCDLEDTLEQVIRQQFHDTKEQKGETVQDRMFKGSSPLATFSAKRRIAFLIGIIDKTYYRELDIIAKIRNLFAHKKETLKFSTNKIANLCLELKSPKLFGAPIQIGKQTIYLTDTPRKQYIFCCRHISQSLIGVAAFHAMNGSAGPRNSIFLKFPT